jgi:hypothetical protein
MSNFEHNRTVVSHRRDRTWGWLAAALVVVLLVVGAIYTTGRWGETATRTGSASTAQVPPATTQPSVPNAGKR